MGARPTARRRLCSRSTIPHDGRCSAGSEILTSCRHRRHNRTVPGAVTTATCGRSGIITGDPFHCGRQLEDRERQTVDVVVERCGTVVAHTQQRERMAKVGDTSTLPGACVPPVRALYCALRHMSEPSVAANAYGSFSQRFADVASVLYCARLSRNAKSVGPLTMPVWNAIRAVATVSGKSDTAEITRYAA